MAYDSLPTGTAEHAGEEKDDPPPIISMDQAQPAKVHYASQSQHETLYPEIRKRFDTEKLTGLHIKHNNVTRDRNDLSISTIDKTDPGRDPFPPFLVFPAIPLPYISHSISTSTIST